MRRPAALALVLLLAASPPSATRRYSVDPSASEVAAKVAFFGISSKTARFPKVSGGIRLDPVRPETAVLDVEIDARALTAPDAVTSQRLKSDKFFWVERYPTVRFAGTGFRPTGERSATLAGAITARGVTRPATLAVTFAEPLQRDGLRRPITLTGKTTIDRRAFGMTAYGLVVGRKVAITIRARMLPG